MLFLECLLVTITHFDRTFKTNLILQLNVFFLEEHFKGFVSLIIISQIFMGVMIVEMTLPSQILNINI